MKRFRGIIATLGITGLAAGCVAPMPLAPSWGLGALPADEGYDLLAAPAPCVSRPLAIYARSASTQVVFAGSRHTVNGDVYTNDGIKLAGTTHRILGQAATMDGVVYAGNGSTVRGTRAAAALAVPVTTTIASRAATFNFPGNVNLDTVPGVWLNKTTLKPGLYRAGGVLSVSKAGLTGTVTFQAREVRIHSVNAQLKAFTDRILVLAGAGGTKLTGSGGRFDGTILAPDGPVAIAGSRHGFRGMIVGDSVAVDGTTHTFTGTGPRDCPAVTPPPSRPAVPTRTPTPRPTPTATPTPAPTPAAVRTLRNVIAWTCSAGKGLNFAPDGRLYIGHTGERRVFRLTADERYEWVAGQGYQGQQEGPIATTAIHDPADVAIDARNVVYAADPVVNTIRKIDPNTGRITIHGRQQVLKALPITSSWNPRAVELDPTGKWLYILSSNSSDLRRLDTATGVVHHLAGGYGFESEHDAKTRPLLERPSLVAPDGPWYRAKFNSPHGMAIDKAGNLYIADTWHHLVRKVDMRDPQNPIVSTIAGDKTKFVFADGRWWKDIEGGHQDGDGATARFNQPMDIAIDEKGDLFVADKKNHCIRKIDMRDPARPMVSTVAGNRTAGHVDGKPLESQFNCPFGIAAKGTNIYVTEACNEYMRVVPKP